MFCDMCERRRKTAPMMVADVQVFLCRDCAQLLNLSQAAIITAFAAVLIASDPENAPETIKHIGERIARKNARP